VGAVALALFVIIKAYSAANYSLTTASALLTTAPLDVLLGTLTSYDYALLPLLALAAWSWVFFSWRATGWTLLSTAIAAFGSITLLLSPWPDLWHTALFLGVVVVVRLVLGCPKVARLLCVVISPIAAAVPRVLRSASGHKRGALPSLPRLVESFFVIAGFWVVFSSLSNLWLPTEVIAVQVSPGPQKVLVGSVLAADDRWTTIILADNRRLVRYRSEHVQSREICHLVGVQPRSRGPVIYSLQDKSYSSPNLGCESIVQGMKRESLAKGMTLELEDGSLPK
jgi:hypothetical protein